MASDEKTDGEHLLEGAPCISLVERGNFTLNSDAFFGWIDDLR